MLELSHKKLIAWQKAIQLLPLIYEVCRKLPKEENYNIISQMKRAGLSPIILPRELREKQNQIRNAFLKFPGLQLLKLIIA
jgi:four helix bundle protein